MVYGPVEDPGADVHCHRNAPEIGYLPQDLGEVSEGTVLAASGLAKASPADVTCTAGAGGAGKTTLLEIMAGLTEPDAGTSPSPATPGSGTCPRIWARSPRAPFASR